MKSRKQVPLALLLGCMLVAVCRAGPTEEAVRANAAGAELLRKGDLAGALEAFGAAVRKDGANESYRVNYAILRRVMRVREELASESDPTQWEALAYSLRSFYAANGVYTEALELDARIHARLKSAETAALLAETQLQLDRDAQAVETLREYGERRLTPAGRCLYGVALTRLGESAEGQRLARSTVLPRSADWRTLLLAARLHALSGEKHQTLALLARAFESSHPGLILDVKARARSCKDFHSLAKDPDFEKVFSTQSRITVSPCSGLSGCGSCPNMGSCAGASSPACGQASPWSGCPGASSPQKK